MFTKKENIFYSNLRSGVSDSLTQYLKSGTVKGFEVVEQKPMGATELCTKFGYVLDFKVETIDLIKSLIKFKIVNREEYVRAFYAFDMDSSGCPMYADYFFGTKDEAEAAGSWVMDQITGGKKCE